MGKFIKIVFCVSILSLFAQSSIQEFFETQASEKYEKASVVRVVDGDTIIVKGNRRVRLIGVDTPESVHPDKSRNAAAGQKASKYTKKLLKKGTIVYLRKDVSEIDKYGRLLRYVWLRKPKKVNKNTIKKYMLNGILVAKGYAYAKEFKPDTKYSKILNSLQKEAEEGNKGILW